MESLPKEEIIAKATELFDSVYAPLVNREQGCLQWAAAVMRVLKESYNYSDMFLCSGTASFKFISNAKDDGKKSNWFSYEFHMEEAVKHIGNGILPEQHAWVALNVKQGNHDNVILVDLTTGFQPAQAKRLVGFEWDADLPIEPYLWCRATEVPIDRIRYMFDLSATKIATILLAQFHREKGIAWL